MDLATFFLWELVAKFYHQSKGEKTARVAVQEVQCHEVEVDTNPRK